MNFTAVDDELDFENVRRYLKESWKKSLKENIPVTNEYRYKCTISISTVDKVRYKIFEIDPKEMR